MHCAHVTLASSSALPPIRIRLGFDWTALASQIGISISWVGRLCWPTKTNSNSPSTTTKLVAHQQPTSRVWRSWRTGARGKERRKRRIGHTTFCHCNCLITHHWPIPPPAHTHPLWADAPMGSSTQSHPPQARGIHPPCQMASPRLPNPPPPQSQVKWHPAQANRRSRGLNEPWQTPVSCGEPQSRTPPVCQPRTC